MFGESVDSNVRPVANGSVSAQPALRDAVANASYDYDEALISYEDALASRDTGKRSLAEERLHSAAARLSAAQNALVSSRVSVPAKPSFADLLADPQQQLDPTGDVMRSVLAYRTAPTATASATPTWADRAPHESWLGTYVTERLVASTVVATAS
jgi:hypothetical protein